MPSRAHLLVLVCLCCSTSKQNDCHLVCLILYVVIYLAAIPYILHNRSWKSQSSKVGRARGLCTRVAGARSWLHYCLGAGESIKGWKESKSQWRFSFSHRPILCLSIYPSILFIYLWMYLYFYISHPFNLWPVPGIVLGFPGGSDGKESTCNAGDLGSIPRLGRSPGEGNGYPMQYSCLENSMDRGAWQTTVHRVTKS